MLGVGRLGEQICQGGCGVLTYCGKDLTSIMQMQMSDGSALVNTRWYKLDHV